jgi:putative cardiolipin synthase
MHDKFIVADSELTVIGGRNIGDRYFAPKTYTREVTNDRDILIWNQARSEDSAVKQVGRYMDLLWDSADSVTFTGKENSVLSDHIKATARDFAHDSPDYYAKNMDIYCAATLPAAKITLIHNPIHAGMKEPLVGYILRELALDSEEQVLLQTPYATGNSKILESLDRVALQTRLIVQTNSLASSPNFPAFSNYYGQRRKFLKTGAALWEYQSTHSIHGKSVVIDGRLSAVGSFNMDDRSLYIDTETMLISMSASARILSASLKSGTNLSGVYYLFSAECAGNRKQTHINRPWRDGGQNEAFTTQPYYQGIH